MHMVDMMNMMNLKRMMRLKLNLTPTGRKMKEIWVIEMMKMMKNLDDGCT